MSTQRCDRFVLAFALVLFYASMGFLALAFGLMLALGNQTCDLPPPLPCAPAEVPR